MFVNPTCKRDSKTKYGHSKSFDTSANICQSIKKIEDLLEEHHAINRRIKLEKDLAFILFNEKCEVYNENRKNVNPNLCDPSSGVGLKRDTRGGLVYLRKWHACV